MNIFQKCRDGEYDNKLPYAIPREDCEIWERYQAEAARLHGKFMNDLAEELDITDNPKRDLLLAKAWNFGYNCGYREVAIIAGGLADLIKDDKQ